METPHCALEAPIITMLVLYCGLGVCAVVWQGVEVAQGLCGDNRNRVGGTRRRRRSTSGGHSSVYRAYMEHDSPKVQGQHVSRVGKDGEEQEQEQTSCCCRVVGLVWHAAFSNLVLNFRWVIMLHCLAVVLYFLDGLSITFCTSLAPPLYFETEFQASQIATSVTLRCLFGMVAYLWIRLCARLGILPKTLAPIGYLIVAVCVIISCTAVGLFIYNSFNETPFSTELYIMSAADCTLALALTLSLTATLITVCLKSDKLPTRAIKLALFRGVSVLVVFLGAIIAHTILSYVTVSVGPIYLVTSFIFLDFLPFLVVLCVFHNRNKNYAPRASASTLSLNGYLESHPMSEPLMSMTGSHWSGDTDFSFRSPDTPSSRGDNMSSIEEDFPRHSLVRVQGQFQSPLPPPLEEEPHQAP